MLFPRSSLCLSIAAFFQCVGIARSRYALFFHYDHWHPLMTHGGANRRRTCIDVLDDDSLLNVFYHCRPPVFLDGRDASDDTGMWGGRWEYEYWWYKLAWVCRRWRRLILASPSYLGISLICRYGTPVADMLAHSPPLPLIIDHNTRRVWVMDPADEGRLLFALRHRDRIRRIRLKPEDTPPRRIIEAIGEEFPLLEYLHIEPGPYLTTNLSLPSTLRAPHLRHLVLHSFDFPFGSPLLAGLVTLSFQCIPSANFGPNELLQQLSTMPHLETLRIRFHPSHFSRHVEGPLLQVPLSTHVTLPTLHWFGFGGLSMYIKVVLPRVTMPLLKVTEIESMVHDESTCHDTISSVLFTLQSLWEIKNPRVSNVKVTFYTLHMVVTMHPHKRTEMPSIHLRLLYRIPDEGLKSTAQVFDRVRDRFTEVGSLTLKDKTECYGGFAIRAKSELCKLLRSFNQVRTLHVSGDDFIREVEKPSWLRSFQTQLSSSDQVPTNATGKDPGHRTTVIIILCNCILHNVSDQIISQKT